MFQSSITAARRLPLATASLARCSQQQHPAAAIASYYCSILQRQFSTDKKRYPRPLRSRKRGIDILQDPLWNKSLAYDYFARDRLGIRGLIPPAQRTLEDQVQRTIGHLRNLPDPTAQNLYLQEIHNRNETLYHRILVDYIEEIAPLVYTPTVGIVCQQFGHRFTRPRGMYFSTKDRGNFSTMVYNWPHDDVHVIVVTDGSRILGLGDLGAHGMGIPIGKLALYCAAGGIAPHRVLPITLDVGTNNKQLREDPNYVGLPHERITGAEYFDFIDEFMQAVYSRWPDVVVQFEDFETSKAVPLLQQYRNEYRCFNDDIQGTGCVTLAGIIAAAKTAGVSITDLRFACAGAGSAGLGVCAQIVDGMVQEGMSREDAMRQFVVFSSKGALGKADGSNGDPNHKRGLNSDTTPWVNAAVSDGDSMLQVMKSFKPDVLLGLSTVPKIFNEELIRTMAAQCKIPIIMPMSNPTSKSECTAEEAYTWTDGRAIVATGSPFDAFELPGSNGKKLIPSQCNNMYVFPGLGLAASVAGIKHITDEMLYLAAVACADSRTAEEISEGRTFPRIRRIREVSLNVACAVIEEGRRTDLCTKLPEEAVLKEGLREYVQKKMYFPAYVPLL